MRKTNFQRFHFVKPNKKRKLLSANDWLMIENAARIMGFEHLKPKILLLKLVKQWQQHCLIHAMIIDVDHVPFCKAQTHELAQNIPPLKY